MDTLSERAATVRRRTVADTERNPGFSESAQRPPNGLTAHGGSAQPRGHGRAIGAKCPVRHRVGKAVDAYMPCGM
ncbi:hypothetical protein GCM10010524_59360 [Streptomyces mexicanus]